MLVERIKNQPVDSNCYVVFQENRKNCIIIDPGTENCSELLTFFKRKNIEPTHIILTHEHFDHIWGVNKLLDKYSPILICSESCLEAIVNKKKNLSLFYDNVGFEVNDSKQWIFSNEIEINNDISIKIVETPGHSSGSITFLIDGYLFTGDTIIMNSKTITKLPGGNKEKLNKSLMKLYSRFYNRNLIVLPGHGEKFNFDDFQF